MISRACTCAPTCAQQVTYVPDIGGVESRVNPDQVAVTAGQSQKGTGGAGGAGAGRGGGGKWAASFGSRATLRRMTWGWVEGFLNVAKAFRRIDATEGTYLKDIQVCTRSGCWWWVGCTPRRRHASAVSG